MAHNTKEATMKTAKILPVIFPRGTVVHNNDKNSTAGPGHDPRILSGWDIRRDMARGMRSDTGRVIKRDTGQHAMRGTITCNLRMPIKNINRINTSDIIGSVKHDNSLLPPVASL